MLSEELYEQVAGNGLCYVEVVDTQGLSGVSWLEPRMVFRVLGARRGDDGAFVFVLDALAFRYHNRKFYVKRFGSVDCDDAGLWDHRVQESVAPGARVFRVVTEEESRFVCFPDGPLYGGPPHC